jgi:hypothetical protein
LGPKQIYNYIRGEFMDAAYAMEEALQACYAKLAFWVKIFWAPILAAISTVTMARVPTFAVKRRR